MALSERDLTRVDERIELGVHRYFDNYLNNVFPRQINEIMEAHNNNMEAHGGVCKKVSKYKWLSIGVLIGLGGLGGAFFERLTGVLH